MIREPIDDEAMGIEWSVDYNDGRTPKAVQLPHAWKQDLAVEDEGPVIYRCQIEVPKEGAYLLFHGVSYAAAVSVDGTFVCEHRGIWDSFSVPLGRYAGSAVSVEVSVVKNGGSTYPVPSVASGLLPYLFNTFGGIYKDVELVPGSMDPLAVVATPADQRIGVKGSQLTLDGEPFYLRGLLHSGWYPELGHPNPSAQQIEEEIASARAFGFNCIKFHLWVPPHEYLEAMEEEGMVAWLELPLYLPSGDVAAQNNIAAELEQIVRQYRRHDNIVAWSIGSELSATVSAAYRERLTKLVRSLTASPMVKDSSGGTELFGGDPREFGTFYDFHPYCDIPFTESLLDSLLPGPRKKLPLLLGEFNDYDAHRDLATLLEDHPYWASALPEFNSPGLRGKLDLPEVLRTSRFAHEPRDSGHEALMKASIEKGAFMRKLTVEMVRSRSQISGYVQNGWRDTPISSSGFFEDWGAPRYDRQAVRDWNGYCCLFLIPTRHPHWSAGGNRTSMSDLYNVWTGENLWRLGIHSERGMHAGGLWRISQGGETVAVGTIDPVSIPPQDSTELEQIFVNLTNEGEYLLEAEVGVARGKWKIHAYKREGAIGHVYLEPGDDEYRQELSEMGFISEDPQATLVPNLSVLHEQGTKRKPFWRECIFRYENDAFWSHMSLADQWERLLPLTTDRVIDLAWLTEQLGFQPEPLMWRIDTRSYQEDPYLVRISPHRYVTTLRPFGGLGSQGLRLDYNPGGANFLHRLFAFKEEND